MNFKKHIIITTPPGSYWQPYDKLFIQIRNGITDQALKKSLTSDWTPAKNDRVYFFPGCTVPRFKVRAKYNTTIKPEYATAAFIAPGEIKATESMFDVMDGCYLVDGKIFGKWLSKVYGKNHYFAVKYHSLLLNCEDYIVMTGDAWDKTGYNCPIDAINDPEGMRDWHIGDRDNIKTTEDYLSFYSPVHNSDLTKLTCPIYLQDAIIKLLNEDNIVINEKKYEELRLMANSSDEENIILVMELMANANYKKSFVYLLLLLKEFREKISNRKKEINHVNFKSLLNFLDLDQRKLDSIDIEQLMTGMKKHKQFTRSNVQRVSQFFAAGQSPDKQTSHPDDGITDTKHFTTGPVLRPELEHLLDDYTEEEEILEPSQEDDTNL